ncbi:unnamed protein product, partial [Discosporangium mesarthrocarpum]
MPCPKEYLGEHYFIAVFCQGDTDTAIQGPEKTYKPITSGNFI